MIPCTKSSILETTSECSQPYLRAHLLVAQVAWTSSCAGDKRQEITYRNICERVASDSDNHSITSIETGWFMTTVSTIIIVYMTKMSTESIEKASVEPKCSKQNIITSNKHKKIDNHPQYVVWTLTFSLPDTERFSQTCVDVQTLTGRLCSLIFQ